MVALLAQSDEALDILRHAEETLDRFGVAWATSVARDVERVVPELEAGGVGVLIVANDSAQPLSARVAALTKRPVLAVPLASDGVTALESLQATAAGGTPVATLAVGRAGAVNAALLAVAILANSDQVLRDGLEEFRREQTQRVLEDRLE
jgi:5-(carboxyamino)imidazole ribonucleotide mutase